MRAEGNASNSGNGLLVALVCLGAIVGGFWFLDERQVEREQKKKEEEETKKKLAPLNEALEQMNRQKQSPTSHDTLSLGAYNRLQEGASYGDVCRILGATGIPTSSSAVTGVPTAEAYQWSSGTKSVTCIFLDKKLVTKAQAGLR